MFNKYATATVERVYSPEKRLGKQAAVQRLGSLEGLPEDIVFTPDHVYTLVRAISARINDNLDGFRRSELLGEVNGFPAHNDKYGYMTFRGKNNHVDHYNQPHLAEQDPIGHKEHRPRGTILHAWYVEDDYDEPVMIRDTIDPVAKQAGKDCWVKLLIANSRKRWPKLCSAIEEGTLTKVSMGAEVTHSLCTVCGNAARHEFEYCFPPGTPVTMADGTLKAIENVEEGDEVLTHKGRRRRVNKTFERNYSGHMSVLRKEGYYAPLRVTWGHELMSNTFEQGCRDKGFAEALYTEKNWDWNSSETITGNSWLQFAYPTEELEFELDLTSLHMDFVVEGDRARLKGAHGRHGKNTMPRYLGSGNTDLAFVLGLYLAEGCLEGQRSQDAEAYKAVGWTFNAEETELIERLRASLDRLGAGESKVYEPKENERNSTSVRLSNAPLAALLKRLASKGAKDKSLSGEVMLAPLSFQKVMLEAYHLGDGCITENHVTGITASNELARQLVILGARCNSTIPTWAQHPNPGGPFNRENDSCRINWIKQHHKHMKYRRKLKEGLVANRVRTVDCEEYEGLVYNIEVEEDNSYVAEGTVVHNCEHVSLYRGAAFSALPSSPFVQEGVIMAGDMVVAAEDNKNLQFFEESWITDQQADPTAVLLDIVRHEVPSDMAPVTAAEQREKSPGDDPLEDTGDVGTNEPEPEFDHHKTPDAQPGEYYPTNPFPCSALTAAAKANPDYPMDVQIDVNKCMGCMYNKSELIGAVECMFPETQRKVEEGASDPLPPGFDPPSDDDTSYEPSGFKNEDGTDIRMLPGLNVKATGKWH